MLVLPWLQGRNVLLRTARNDRRGFICKLADFGLSRMLGQEQTHVEVRGLIFSPRWTEHSTAVRHKGACPPWRSEQPPASCAVLVGLLCPDD